MVSCSNLFGLLITLYHNSLAATYTYYRSLSQEQSLKDRGLHEQRKIERRRRQRIQRVSLINYLCHTVNALRLCHVISCIIRTYNYVYILFFFK